MSHKHNKGKNLVGSLHPSVSDAFIADLLAVLDRNSAEFAECPSPHLDNKSRKAQAFKYRYLRSQLLSKFTVLDKRGASERRSKAITKWLKMENRNSQTNLRLFYGDRPTIGGICMEKLIKKAKEVVVSIIGEDPDLAQAFSRSHFTGGASTRVKRGPAAIAEKFVGKAHVTTRAWPYIRDLIQSSYVWSLGYDCTPVKDQDYITVVDSRVIPEFVQGSALFTVPKNSDIDRVACKEPELNMYLQRGVGLYLSRLLRARGVNLNDQTRNQRLARVGSIDGSLATLDLSSASDCVSTTLVNLLLPPAWFVLLDDIRVHSTLVDGEWHELDMFSSMGNGFTFELESLLFYALACAINHQLGVRGTISVYGDDIIVPVESSRVFQRVFSWFGFILNTDKSFTKGAFRESCGKHWFSGVDVTPFYIRSPILHQTDLIHALNRLRIWLCQNADYGAVVLDSDLSEFFQRWKYKVHRSFWGGQDGDRIDSLVTGHPPRRVLRRAKLDAKLPVFGAYLHWLHEGSLPEGRETSSASYEGRWVSRPNAAWRRGDLQRFDAEINTLACIPPQP